MAGGLNVTIDNVTVTQTKATFLLTNIASGTLTNCTVEVYDSDNHLVAATAKFTFVNNTSMNSETGDELQPGTAYTAIFKSEGMAGGTATFTTQQAPDVPKVFRYWAKDGLRYDFTEQVTSNFTLEAVWADVYTVSFVDSFGDTVAPDQRVVSASEFVFVLPDAPVIPGYEFTGWYSSVDGHKWNPDVDIVTQNMTLTAVYTSAT